MLLFRVKGGSNLNSGFALSCGWFGRTLFAQEVNRVQTKDRLIPFNSPLLDLNGILDRHQHAGIDQDLATFCRSRNFVGSNSFAMSKPRGKCAFNEAERALRSTINPCLFAFGGWW